MDERPDSAISDAWPILDRMSLHHDGKFAWVIYRCDYSDEAKWQRFMGCLNKWLDWNFKNNPQAYRLKDYFSWDIHEDEAVLSGASVDKVRRLFEEWVESVDGRVSLTRYRHCIYVDHEVIDSVLANDHPDIFDSDAAYVKLITDGPEDPPFQYTEDDIPDEVERSMLNAGDEGYPPIDGCRRRDIGWMKFSAPWLVPRAYRLLMNGGINTEYTRPPGIKTD